MPPLWQPEPAPTRPAVIPASTAADLGYEEAQRLRGLVTELAQRQAEALRLYEPLPDQLNFHASATVERLLRGSNRGGKTLPAAIEVARIVTGQDPFRKLPERNGRCYAVGKDGKHVAEVMWFKLSRAGAFKMIRDEQSGLWRAYRPWQPGDAARDAQAKPAPPIIPPRLIAEIAWENKKLGQPSKVILTTGWELTFFSSEGKPPQGADVDLVWFDEEIVDGQWYPEMAARLLDRQGRFVWSATPQAATEQLFDLHCRAVDGDPLVHEVIVLLRNNPHIKQTQKDQLAAKLSEDERRVRIEGEFLLTSFRVYPEFAAATHVIYPRDLPGGVIPEAWMRVAVVDPGRQVCAALFVAIPEHGDEVYFYDQLYLKGCNAAAFAEAFETKVRHHSFHVWLIDGRAARQGEIGSGKTIMHQYVRALRRLRLRNEAIGCGFRLGSDDVKGGLEAVRELLRIRGDGRVRLRVVAGACTRERDSFTWEIGRYHYKRLRGLVTDDPEQKHNHLMDCARYFAAADLGYRRPRQPKKAEDGALAALKAKRKRIRQRELADGVGHVHLGPGKGASYAP